MFGRKGGITEKRKIERAGENDPKRGRHAREIRRKLETPLRCSIEDAYSKREQCLEIERVNRNRGYRFQLRLGGDYGKHDEVSCRCYCLRPNSGAQ